MFATSIRLRLLLTLLLIIGAGAAVQAVSYAAERGEMATLQEESIRLLDLGAMGHELGVAVDAQHDGLMTYLLTESPTDLAAYHAAGVRIAGLAGAARASLAEGDPLFAVLDEIGRAGDAWRGGFAEPEILLVAADRGAAARSPSRVAAGETLHADASAATAVFVAQVGTVTARNVDKIEAIEQTQLALFLVGTAGAACGILLALLLTTRWILHPLGYLLATARRVEAGDDVPFRAQRDDEIGRLGHALERMRGGLFGQATEASVVNRFTELTAFVEADGDVARATLDALEEIAAPDDAMIHISNRSKDRAIPEGSIGAVAPAMVALGQLGHCPGVRRGSLFVTADLGERLAVHCPIHPAAAGTLACIPLQALGEVVGAVHLHWSAPNALPLDVRSAVTRITDHASLAIANRRLMTALQGMASTDSRTGLPNSRTFDEALAKRLESRNQGDPISVLMLDVDHFKLFNDRNGHPAGDQALRTFAGILAEAVRDLDMAARYGGEEFVVMLPGASPADAAVVAERIRARTEKAVIDLSPGHRDAITVSIGIATWPLDAGDRVKLLEVADAALYRAKTGGRNRVVLAGEAFNERVEDAQGPGPDPWTLTEVGGADAALAPTVPVALPDPHRLSRAG